MPDSPYLARLKARKSDLEAKLKRLESHPKDDPGLELSKIATAGGIGQLDAEIKRLSQPTK